jgi:pimeloyl-ACP methyl ester carboxylesterase
VLVVPQDRRDPASPEVRVPFAAFKGASPAARSPIVYLSGGPGETWSERLAALLPGQTPGLLSGARLDRDEVVIEQRGSAMTQPRLDRCDPGGWAPETHRAWQPALAEAARHASQCAATLQAEGVRLAGFNTDEMAHDVADLVRLLGYGKVTVAGVSYGTMWASAVMREHADIVDAAVLDSVLQQARAPLAHLVEGLPAALQAAGGPALLQQVHTLATTLDAQPLAWQRGPAGGVASGALMAMLIPMLTLAPHEVADFVEFLQSLADSGQSLDLLADNEQASLKRLAGFGSPVQPTAQFLSIACADNARVDAAEIAATVAATPAVLRPHAQAAMESFRTLCDAWPARRDLPARSFEPVRSNVPVLVLSGDTDALTPPAWAQAAVATLPQATWVRFAHRGHSLLGTSACAQTIARSFLAGASPDTTCAAADRAN